MNNLIKIKPLLFVIEINYKYIRFILRYLRNYFKIFTTLYCKVLNYCLYLHH
jgi:hypothetical protein